MKREVMEKWGHALRWGNYDQTYGCLREESDPINLPGDYAFCALGVLCDLYVKEQCGGYWDSLCRPKNIGENPPAAVIEWAGLVSPDPDLNAGTPSAPDYLSISELNDGDTPFSELASLIAAQWESL